MKVPRWLGWMWLISGILGVVTGLAVATLGTAAIRLAGRDARVALDASSAALDRAVATMAAGDATLSQAETGLRGAEDAIAESAVVITQVARVSGDLETLVTEDVPSSLDAVRATLPGLIDTARVLDRTMRALSVVGVDYDPELPLDQSIEALDSELAGIPASLRAQQGVMDDASRRLRDLGSQVLGVSIDLGRVRDGLAEARTAGADLSTEAERAGATLGDLRDLTGVTVDLATAVAIVAGLGLAIAQTAPAFLGWWVVSGSQRSPGAPAGDDSLG